MPAIAIINGPNLNLIGNREPEIYGNKSLSQFLTSLEKSYPHLTIYQYQSNIEGELINFLHSCIGKVEGVILNAGAYTHTSIAIADAVAAIGLPVIEVHISNVFAREEFRKQSYIASKCIGSITGLGLEVYRLAIHYFMQLLSPETS